MLLSRRQTDSSSHTTALVIALVVIIASILVITGVSIFYARRAKRLQARHGYTKRKSWRQSLASFSSGFSRPPAVRSDVRDSAFSLNVHRDVEEQHAEDRVDRNTSVRSVMTLPAYSAKPRENEGVIGRAGERAGIDTVVEFPEPDEEEEARRDQEMESLYQIRLRRREEAQARAERRRLRQAARERGDYDALRTLRQESRRQREEREVAGSIAMIAEHELQTRGRKVSAVSYGDLGVARHDGSRVRANSNESDNRPLLNAANAFGVSAPVRPWLSRDIYGGHRRGRSSASNLSVTSFGSDDHSGVSDTDSEYDMITLRQSSSRTASRPPSQARPGSTSRPRSQARPVSGARSRTASTGNVLTLDTDVGSSRTTPSAEPPQYDTVDLGDAPPYESPIRQRLQLSVSSQLEQRPTSSTGAPQLPSVQRLPSIRLTESTPIDARHTGFPDFSTYTSREASNERQ